MYPSQGLDLSEFLEEEKVANIKLSRNVYGKEMLVQSDRLNLHVYTTLFASQNQLEASRSLTY